MTVSVYEQGLRGFMRGAMATLARELPGNAVWFLTYEAITRRLLERKLQQSQQWVKTTSTTTMMLIIIIIITNLQLLCRLPHTADKPFEPVLSMTDVVMAGGTAGALYWLVPYPLDTGKFVNAPYALLVFIDLVLSQKFNSNRQRTEFGFATSHCTHLRSTWY